MLKQTKYMSITKLIKTTLLALLLLSTQLIQAVNLKYEGATAFSDNKEIVVSTGAVEGSWKWTGSGFVSTGFKNLATGTQWGSQQNGVLADWDLGNLSMGNAKLLSVEATVSDDDKFTSKHIAVVATIEYPVAKLVLKYLIWAYPGASGLRTQLLVKALKGFVADTTFNSNLAKTDFLPAKLKGLKFQTVGFYNDHDGRNQDSLQMVDVIEFKNPAATGSYPDANMLFVYNDNEGFGLVKESQKVVNEPSVNTGVFTYDEKGVYNSGWGLSTINIVTDKFRPCWAVWRMAWKGNDDDKQLAIKMFDRKRYPIINKHDIFLMTNVWGGGKSGASAKEENILKEISSCADLGIDVCQIDAGWGPDAGSTKTWEPSKTEYPQGWTNIMKAANEKGVTLGIWNRALDLIKFPDRLRGLYDAGFRYYKIDIAGWDTYNTVDSLNLLARDLVKYSDYTARINWDITHKSIRVGYLYGREYGNLFLQNRRLIRETDTKPTSHIYIPRRILKDQWMASQYLNLNEILINVQNTDLVHKDYSNAHLYGNVYSFAIAMMSSPLFFQETWRYNPEVREPLRNLIRVYKKYRVDMYNGYVFPIGDLANDASWTGFQNYNPETSNGYLTIFREINNTQSEKSIKLKFLKGKKIQVENLMTGEKTKPEIDAEGNTIFKMDKPASFLFLKYSEIN